MTGQLLCPDSVVQGLTRFWFLQAYKTALHEFWQYCKKYAEVKQTSEKRAKVECLPST